MKADRTDRIGVGCRNMEFNVEMKYRIDLKLHRPTPLLTVIKVKVLLPR